MTTYRSLFALALTITVVAAGCSGGQTGDIAPPNCSGPMTPDTWYELADVTPLDFSGQDVLAALPVETTTPLDWDDGRSSVLTVTLRHDATIQNQGLVHFVRPFSDDAGCVERLDVPVELGLSTDDGLLAETFIAILSSDTSSSGRLAQVDYAEMFQGTVDLSAFAKAGTWDPSSATVMVEIDFDSTSSAGILTLITHQEEGSGDPPHTPIATW